MIELCDLARELAVVGFATLGYAMLKLDSIDRQIAQLVDCEREDDDADGV